MAFRIIAAIAAALALFALGSIFGLNGSQWDWWRWASWSGGAVALAAALVRPKLPSPRVLIVGLSGVTLLAASTAVMANRYSDPYSGPLLWPHVLAILAFLGFTALVGSVAARRR